MTCCAAKKTATATVTSGSGYVLQVKNNQPKLLAHIQVRYAAEPTPRGWHITSSNSCAAAALMFGKPASMGCHGPVVPAAWAGLARFVVVVKTVTYRRQTTRSSAAV